MSGWSVSDKLFYGGIGVMAGAVILAVVCGVIFGITGRHLKKKLTQEYGERKRR